MTEDEAIKARAQQREFPETMEIFGNIRTALAAKLFETKLSDKDIREDLYLRVQTLDAMISEMGQLLSASAGEQAILEYVESIATSGK